MHCKWSVRPLSNILGGFAVYQARGQESDYDLQFAWWSWSHTKIKCINSFQLLAITFLHDCVFPITIITIYCTLYYYHRSGCRQATVSLSVSLPRSHYTVSLHAHPNERPLSHELWLMDKNAIARECTVLYDVVGRFLLALQQRDDQVKKSLCKRGEDWGGSN